MNDKQNPRDTWQIILFTLLVAAGLGLIALGIYRATNNFDDGLIILAMGVLGVIVPAAIYPLLSRQTAGQSSNGDRVEELLTTISERMLLSDQAKRIAYREQDRTALRKAIEHDIANEEYDVALVLIKELGETYGYREEAENLRQKINDAQAKQREKLIDAAINKIEALCQKYDWDRAFQDAERLMRLYPNVSRVAKMRKQVEQAREKRKRELEREFLRAAEVDDVETAMDLVNELDKYLTPEEAEPYRETARGVFGKKRQNLGLTFKLAVENRDWLTALNAGDQIIADFPNSKYAEEVRGMLDVLRERAAGQRAAEGTRSV